MTTPIRIVCSMATRQLLADLVAPFHATHATRVEVISDGGVNVAKRVAAGEAFDVVALARDAIDKLIAGGSLIAGSRADLVDSGVSAAVRAGAPTPDIGSEDALKQAVLAAATIGHSTGPSGVKLVELFGRWGILDEVRDRLVEAPASVPVGSLIAEGRVALGFQQTSELLHLPGITLLGPLPDAVQITTTFSAAISPTTTQEAACRELLAFIASQDGEVGAIKRGHGMDPVRPR